MKRYLATQIVFNSQDLESFNTKIESDKTKFEDTTEFKDAKKDLENAQKAYDQSLTDEKMDEVIYLELLEQARSVFDTLINSQIVVKCEDSLIDCPQLGERVLFVENYHETDILEKEIIQLEKPFFVDDGEKFIPVTKDNYKDFKLTDILKVKTDKYDIKEF